MTAAQPLSVELPDDLREFVDEQLRSGRYANATEVLRDAFSVLRQRQERVDSLRAALQTGVAQLDSGDFIEGTREGRDGFRPALSARE
ncbi:type II toxin-antitoxin system ParD family antitoxin [Enhygromyxa salina]|uniref:type II toxin-antitoxin system ParD family antitoxin n=1 Tax=Enhygromyxa salina TaxID=215803 RepID=UPI000698FF71|nr:type II toxin-antitoxin system ParD family antitoxin [Enhygromyxa salina]